MGAAGAAAPATDTRRVPTLGKCRFTFFFFFHFLICADSDLIPAETGQNHLKLAEKLAEIHVKNK